MKEGDITMRPSRPWEGKNQAIYETWLWLDISGADIMPVLQRTNGMMVQSEDCPWLMMLASNKGFVREKVQSSQTL